MLFEVGSGTESSEGLVVLGFAVSLNQSSRQLFSLKLILAV
jgi:hypothetical protein